MGSGRDLSECFNCIKYLLFAFNFLFWLIGCGLIGFGIWMLVGDFKEYLDIHELEPLKYFGWAVIIVGGVVTLIGFFGCCGGIRESQCLLVSFFICLFFLFSALSGGGIFLLVEKDDIFSKVNDMLEEGAAAIRTDKTSPSQVFTVAVQQTFGCCASADQTTVTDQLRVICSYAPGDQLPPTDENFAKPNCTPKLKDFVDEYAVIIGGVLVGIGVIMLLGMIFSILLCCAIRDVA